MDGTPVKDTDRSQLVPLWSLDLLRETLAKCHHKPIRWSELYSRLKNEKGILEPPLHEACIPTTIKLDTGVDIDNEEEFWDVSSISGDECSFTISRNLGIPDVEESKESVHTGDMFATSTEFNTSSFSGFLHEYSSVIYNEDQPVGGGSLSMDSVLGDTLVGAEAAIDTGSQMAEHRKVVKDQILPGYPSTNKTNITRSPVKTRASGKVEDYPLVLPRPLEYSVRKRKRIRLNTT
jgi:carbonic anhydrase/acetyltransferase-like protein (isoleucine patch superfamily)